MSDINQNYEDLLKEAEELVISAIASTMDLYGVTPSIGRLYGYLYFMNEPVTLDQMSQELGMSKPSMSTSIRSLQQIDMVQKVWKTGVRKDLYNAEKDFFKSFFSFFCKKWEREISVNLEAIKLAEEKLTLLVNDENVPVGIYEKTKMNLKQLEESKNYYYFLKKLVKVFENKEILKMINDEIHNED
ncbi:choline uptake/conversion transcriptional regulator CudC [Niallia sp. 01092]|uniref:choline uptake/conversion transcriptional regulator CudC n=1 Tax=unclassified Niallia TaxID=2837522 RepID=UPI003FD1D31F